MTIKKQKCACRYPGCGMKFEYTNLRGRHEAMKHGGVFPKAAVSIVNGSPSAPTVETAVGYLQHAIKQLSEREASLIAQLAGMDKLRMEADELSRQRGILAEALKKLSGGDIAAEAAATLESVRKFESSIGKA